MYDKCRVPTRACILKHSQSVWVDLVHLRGAQAQKAAGVDAVIMDDVGRLTKATGKASSAFNRPLRSPSSFQVKCGVVQGISAAHPFTAQW